MFTYLAISTASKCSNSVRLSVYLYIGGSLSGDLVTDEELFIRWLEIAAFLPVISFHTPPWVCGEDQVSSREPAHCLRSSQDSESSHRGRCSRVIGIKCNYNSDNTAGSHSFTDLLTRFSLGVRSSEEWGQLDVLKRSGRLSFLLDKEKKDIREVLTLQTPLRFEGECREVPTDVFLQKSWRTAETWSKLRPGSPHQQGEAGLYPVPLCWVAGMRYWPRTAGKQNQRSPVTGIDTFDNVVPELRFLLFERMKTPICSELQSLF